MPTQEFIVNFIETVYRDQKNWFENTGRAIITKNDL